MCIVSIEEKIYVLLWRDIDSFSPFSSPFPWKDAYFFLGFKSNFQAHGKHVYQVFPWLLAYGKLGCLTFFYILRWLLLNCLAMVWNSIVFFKSCLPYQWLAILRAFAKWKSNCFFGCVQRWPILDNMVGKNERLWDISFECVVSII